MNQLIAIPAHEVTGLAHGVTNAEDMESPEAPINGLNARYGVFWISSQKERADICCGGTLRIVPLGEEE